MVEASLWPELESLYRLDFAQFVRVARAVTGDRDSALEAVQEGFADALRNSSQWQGRGPLAGWVWRCVLNRARKARSRPNVELRSDDGRNGSVEAGDDELRLRLAALPERQRLVVFMRYYADLEYSEIAAALGIQVGTVPRRCTRRIPPSAPHSRRCKHDEQRVRAGARGPVSIVSYRSTRRCAPTGRTWSDAPESAHATAHRSSTLARCASHSRRSRSSSCSPGSRRRLISSGRLYTRSSRRRASVALDDAGRLRTIWRCRAGEDCGAFVKAAALSPDGRDLALVTGSTNGLSLYQGGLHVIDLVTGADRRIPAPFARQAAPEFELQAWRRLGRAATHALGCAEPHELTWSPDGSRLAYVCAGHIYTVRPDGTGRRLLPTGTVSAYWPTWSPDGRRIVFSTRSEPARSTIYAVTSTARTESS